jgi:hypothetical protein
LEERARAAVVSSTGRELTQEEWRQYRAALLEFVTMVCGWKRGAPSAQADLPKAA